MKSTSSGVLSRSKPVSINSGRRHQLAKDSATALPKTTRRKASLARSSSTLVRRKRIHATPSDTSKRRLGGPNPLLGKDHAGYEECSPILINPRTMLDFNTRYPRRVAHEDTNNYNDPINASLPYATLCARDPAVSLSRTQLAPSQLPIPASPSYRIATATLGNPHAGITADNVPSAQRAPRGSSSNLDVEGWSPETSPGKHHKQSMPMRLHSQRGDRPIEYEHIMPCWNQARDWEPKFEMQDDLMPSSGRVLPASAAVGVAVGTGSTLSSGGCHHHRQLTTLPDQSDPFFYPESGAMNMEWETKQPITHTASFTAFPRNYASLQVPSQRTYHSTISPQLQEPFLGTSVNTSSSRNGFQCSQQSAAFPSYACTTPTCCNQGLPMTPTNGGRPSTTNVMSPHTQNYGHSHYGGCGCPNMHQSRSPEHFHQYVAAQTGPISASGSNTSANLNAQMQNTQALRRAVRPPRTMLLNAAAAGAHITNSRGRMAARQNVHGRRPYRNDHCMSYTRVHHCRRLSTPDCPHRNSCRVHSCSLSHLSRSSSCQ